LIKVSRVYPHESQRDLTLPHAVIEVLRQRDQSGMTTLELPDEDMLLEIEQQLLLSLPADLRLFLLSVSNVAYGSLEPVTASDPALHTYLPEVAAMAWSLGLPRDLIPLCESGGGYYACDASGAVYLWPEGVVDEESNDEAGWPSLWLWCEEVWLKA